MQAEWPAMPELCGDEDDPWLQPAAWKDMAARHWRSAAVILLMSSTGFGAVLLGQNPVLHAGLAALTGRAPRIAKASPQVPETITELAEAALPAAPDVQQDAPALSPGSPQFATVAITPDPLVAPAPARLAPPALPPVIETAQLSLPPASVLTGQPYAAAPPVASLRHAAAPILAVLSPTRLPARLPPIPPHGVGMRPPIPRVEPAMFTVHVPAAHAIHPGLPRWLTDPAPRPRRVLIMSEPPHNLDISERQEAAAAEPPPPQIAEPPYVGASYPYASPYAQPNRYSAGQSWYRAE